MVITFLALFLLHLFEPAQVENPWDCIENLNVPEYSRLARMAQLQGKVIVEVDFSTSKKPVITLLSKNTPLLSNAAIAAVRQSSFSKTCALRTIQIVFDFEIDKKLPEIESDHVYVSIEKPLVVHLRAHRFPVMPD